MIPLADFTHEYGSKSLFANAALQILPSSLIGLVDLNGADKTTIFRLITDSIYISE